MDGGHTELPVRAAGLRQPGGLSRLAAQFAAAGYIVPRPNMYVGSR